MYCYRDTVSSIVLISGGLDSAVLLAAQAQHGVVHPLYVSVGLAWEHAELQVLRALLTTTPAFARLRPLTTVQFDMRDVYAEGHWAIRGIPPAYDTPDSDVYLAGRNIVLLAKASMVAAARRVETVALGVLAGNPFPDARPEFFSAMGRALSLGLDHAVQVVTPLARLHKPAVIALGLELGVPVALTLSCMSPVAGLLPQHCGRCSKCRERRDAFVAAGVTDPTTYAQESPR